MHRLNSMPSRALHLLQRTNIDQASPDRNRYTWLLQTRNSNNSTPFSSSRERWSILQSWRHEIGATLQLLDHEVRRQEKW